MGIVLSIIVPVFNEEGSLPELCERLVRAAETTGRGYEILLVNDGSRDRTYDIMKELREKHGTVRVVDFDGRFGQHAALLAGIIMSRGELVCPIDADLQNDPGDVIPMLEKLEEGYDVVKGVRVKRMAPWLRKRYSFIANKVLRLLVNHEVRDYGCHFGVYRKSLFRGLIDKGRMPKHILLYAFRRGVKMAEIPVKDLKRRDTSRYKFLSLLKIFMEVVMTFLIYSKKGYAFFEFWLVMSYVNLALVLVMSLAAVFDRLSASVASAALFVLLALGLGQLLAHLMVRKHILEYDMEFGGKPPYRIREILG